MRSGSISPWAMGLVRPGSSKDIARYDAAKFVLFFDLVFGDFLLFLSDGKLAVWIRKRGHHRERGPRKGGQMGYENIDMQTCMVPEASGATSISRGIVFGDKLNLICRKNV